MNSLSRPRLLATPRTAAYQAPPSMGFPRQEYWSGVPLPSPKTHFRGGQINWEPGIDIRTLLYIKQIATKDPLLYSTGNSTQCSLMVYCVLSRVQLCDSMGCSSPGCSVHGILQGRILVWVAIYFSRRSSQPRDQVFKKIHFIHFANIHFLTFPCSICDKLQQSSPNFKICT